MQVATPGVYTFEFEPAPPIQGLGPQASALIGLAAKGPIAQPQQITSWDAFKGMFGSQPVLGHYLWYAVRGFFVNGGTICYVVRVSNAGPASMTLTDANSKPTILVQSLATGTSQDNIKIKVESANAVSGDVFRHEATVPAGGVVGPEVTVTTAAGVLSPDDALQFRPGDWVIVNNDVTTRATVVSINGAKVRLDRAVSPPAGATTIRLADISHTDGDTVVRLEKLAGSPADLASGSVLQVQQVVGAATNTQDLIVASVVPERLILSASTVVTYRVTAVAAVLQDIDLSGGAASASVKSEEFKLTVTGVDNVDQVFDRLAMSPASPNYYQARVNTGVGASKWVTLQPASPPNTSIPPLDIPANPATPNLAGGQDENLSTIAASDYQTAIDSLETVIDVGMVAVPDSQSPAVQSHVLSQCETLANRFAILDPAIGAPVSGTGSVVQQQAGLTSSKGYAAIYFPWLLVDPAPLPPGSPAPAVPLPNVLVPPSGHIAGIYSRTDALRGVHKAPAGIEATVGDTVGLERLVSDTEQGILNLQYGVNVIRVFRPGGRLVVWGARTTATGIDSNWQYVSTRRLFIFLEGSIIRGLRFAVFEPNTTGLWQKVKLSLTAFLTGVWRDGALFGATAQEAFYVRIDDALNPPTEQQLGRLNIEIGVRPAYPAEFVIVRIGIWQGGSQVSEQ
jgi:hypothetical protein